MLDKFIGLSLVLSAALMAGCGNGGSSDSTGGPPPPAPLPPPPPSISLDFTATGSPAFGHAFGAAVRLGDGRVLVTGGAGVLDSAEIYDPETGQFHLTSNMTAARWSHTATLLQDGRVLIAGGADADLRSAEVFDPEDGRFSAVGSMISEHSIHTATLLDNGQVLIAGMGSAELFDPITNSFSPAGPMHFPRWGHTATKLPNGRVLIIGGENSSTSIATAIATAEIYDPASDAFSDFGQLAKPRTGHGAVLLGNGKVLVVGGRTNSVYTTSTELFEAGTFVSGPLLRLPHSSAASTVLSSGNVLVTGGFYDTGLCNFDPCPVATDTAELYDANTNSFVGTGEMSTERAGHSAFLLQDGSILIIGGNSNATADLFRE
jgi:hypothetical protein